MLTTMTYSDKLAQYLDAILQAKAKQSESACSKAADNFEDDLLEFENFPDEYFEFVLNLLSKEEFYSRPGIWNFLLVLGTEKHKLLLTHYDRISVCIVDYYREYTDEDLCLAACDFIARNYAEASARKLLNKLKDIEKEKDEDLRGFADDGLRILEQEIIRSQT